MNMLAVDVDYQFFGSNSPCVIVKGVEENLAKRFHNKFLEISKVKTPKSVKTEGIVNENNESEKSVPLADKK